MKKKWKGVIWSYIVNREQIIWKDICYYIWKDNNTFTIREQVKSMVICLLRNIRNKK